jgi:prephenate dehydrogenase
MNKICIIGVGLIGGSLALDIKQLYDDVTILGIDNNPDHLEEAQQLGIIHEKGVLEDCQNADLVIVAIPVNAVNEVVLKLLDIVSYDTLIMDVGSTKHALCKAVKHHTNRRNFLATHPIAGTEFSGPSAAIKGLFQGKTNIICEVEQTAFKLQDRAMKLFAKLGMRIRYMNPDSHDRHIAYVSHLSHISSFMLGKTVIEKEQNERDIFDLAGSGFESTVRLAKSSPAMWTPIFEQNKAYVLETLSEYIANLNHFKNLMENDNFDGVFETMSNTNYIKEILSGIVKNG